MVARWQAWRDGSWAVRGASWRWDQVLQRDARIGREAGLIEHQKPGMWHCRVCEQDVAQGFLENHVKSRRHRAWQDYLRHMEEVAEKQKRGELPPWMTVKEGAEYCTLCWVYATEAHLASARHQRRLAYFEHRVGATQLPALTCGASYEWKADEVPPDWGNPTFYKWQAGRGCFWCKLCWKNVDDPHVYSQKHQQRMRHPEPFLDREDLANLYKQDWSTVPQPTPPPSPPALGWGAGGASAGWNATQASGNLGAAAEDSESNSEATIIPGNAEGGAGGIGTFHAVEAFVPGVPLEHGYITFSKGDLVRALYHGTSGDNLGWSYGYAIEGERGWFPTRCIGGEDTDSGPVWPVWL